MGPATVALAAVGSALLAEPAAGHAGSLSGSLEPTPVPSWLVVLTGGGIVGASFLFTSLLTDHALVRAINGRGVRVPVREAVRGTIRTTAYRGARLAGVAVLLLVVASGLFGPAAPTASFAVLVVWAGWWAGYAMSVYLLGNTWPTLNPWRTLAEWLAATGLLARTGRASPGRLGVWPSVAGLLLLIWIEVVSPVAEEPRLLAALVLVYTALTLASAARYGTAAWFRRVDPIARVFRYYGRLAPLQRTERGIELALPGSALAERRAAGRADETAFVVALLWVTTYDGLVLTPAWAAFARAVVGLGVPALVVYLLAMVAGFGLFYSVYAIAARLARRTADSYVAAGFIRDWFAPALVPIAAGYHLAHFAGYFLGLAPALGGVLATPFSAPATVTVLAMPGWFGGLQLGFVVLGHLLAVWVAHARSFEVFTGRLQPVRSQYPFILVMIAYTAASLWIVAQPSTSPPFL
ncbi:hypothetical protein BRC90_09155 [Halobacteriales archaeon QS_4_69_34]|nr:MAG: hypothetical protein BRC90_09155 [Halobacteriales archaeon QS_4_69_34]